MGDHDLLHPGAARFGNQQQIFLGRGVSGSEHQFMPGDGGDDRPHFRQQRAIARDGHERPILLVEAHLVLGIGGGHPDDAAPPSFERRHVLDSGQVHAPNGPVQRDSAEDFYSRNLLAHDVGKTRGGVLMTL